MTKVDTTAAISDSLKSVYEHFDAEWASGKVPRIEDFLPTDLGCDERRPVLLELVLIDLDYRWQRGGQQIGEGTPKGPLLEDCLRQYTELQPLEQLPVKAIVHEFQARRRAGDAPTFNEYAQRFPHRVDELQSLLGSARSPAVVCDTESLSQSVTTLVEPLVVSNESPSSNQEQIDVSALRNPVPDLTAGQAFGRYRIEELLGRGGMGAVYRAFDHHLRRMVAIKVPVFKQGLSLVIVLRFLREARAVARLSHPGICRVFDVGVIDGVLFLTMELIEGQSLDKFAPPNQPQEEQVAIPLVMQVASALQDAHEHGIVHRDLKPANIMLNGKGRAILMDFGLARNIEGNELELTNAGELLGTPSYMSPEQVRGESNSVGPTTDIYSLGVVLYRLLAGRSPFEGKQTAVLVAISTENPPPPRKFNSNISPALEEICLRAMAKLPNDRFRSAKELAEALADYVASNNRQTPAAATNAVMSAESSASDASSATVPFLRVDNKSPKVVPVAVAACVIVLLVVSAVVWNSSGRRDSGSSSSSSIAQGATVSPEVGSKATSNSQISKGAGSSTKPDDKPLVKQRPVAALATFEVLLQRAEQEAGVEVLRNQSLPLAKQDKLQLHIALNGPSFVYVFWIDTDGICQRLWPETSELLDRERQQPIRELWLPQKTMDNAPKQKMFFLDSTTGLETIMVATSSKPLGIADLRPIENTRVDLAHFDPDRQELVSYRPERWRKAQPECSTLLLPAHSGRELLTVTHDRDRGLGGVVEANTAVNVPINDFTKRLNDVFTSFSGVVFPHE